MSLCAPWREEWAGAAQLRWVPLKNWECPGCRGQGYVMLARSGGQGGGRLLAGRGGGGRVVGRAGGGGGARGRPPGGGAVASPKKLVGGGGGWGAFNSPVP